MKWGNDRGVIAEEGPAGACIAWEGGMAAGMNKPARAVVFWTKGPPTEIGGFTVVEGDPGMGGGTDGGEGRVCREPLSAVIGAGFIWSLGISRSDLEKCPC